MRLPSPPGEGRGPGSALEGSPWQPAPERLRTPGVQLAQASALSFAHAPAEPASGALMGQGRVLPFPVTGRDPGICRTLALHSESTPSARGTDSQEHSGARLFHRPLPVDVREQTSWPRSPHRWPCSSSLSHTAVRRMRAPCQSMSDRSRGHHAYKGRSTGGSGPSAQVIHRPLSLNLATAWLDAGGGDQAVETPSSQPAFPVSPGGTRQVSLRGHSTGQHPCAWPGSLCTRVFRCAELQGAGRQLTTSRTWLTRSLRPRGNPRVGHSRSRELQLKVHHCQVPESGH